MDIQTQLRALFRQYANVGLAEAVYLTLRDAIGAELLPCGTKLSEVELAGWFQVSRTPVQKALIRLECEELIVYEHKCGYSIEKLDFQQSRDVNELYLGLYTVSTILAINRHLDQYYNQLLRQRLKMLEGETNIMSFMRLDYDFHMQIAHSTGNQELINTLVRTNSKTYLMFMGSKECPADTALFIKEHLVLTHRLYDLLRTGTAMEAAAFMETEHNPHMCALVGAWNHPNCTEAASSLR